MIKVFTLNKNGKIELTKKELEQLLNESYWEGYKNNNLHWVYTSPSINTYPYVVTTCDGSHTINANDLTSNSITIKSNLGD